MLRKRIGWILVFILICGTLQAREDAPQITRFVPQDTIQTVRQARAVFSSPMVSFGDPGAAAEPFTVSCPVPGRGRWADPHNWVYDFEKDLPGGIRCSFKPVAGLNDLSGQAVIVKERYTFSTGGPAVIAAIPDEGSRRIAEDQVFILTLTAPATEASVLAHAGFAVTGIRQRVDVRIIRGEERDAILKTNSWLLNTGVEPDRYLLLQCRQRFPERDKVTLIWGKGVQSASGVATTKDQLLRFQVREPFLAEFHCDRENPHAGCIPVLPLTLDFNASLDPSQTGDVVLKGPGGRTQSVPLDASSGQVRFNGPFPENAEFQLEIPPALKDDAGRPLANGGRFPLKFRTASYPVLAKFAARFGIIELNAEPALPLTLRNIEADVQTRMIQTEKSGSGMSVRVTGRHQTIDPDRAADVLNWLRKVASAGREKSLFGEKDSPRTFTIPGARGNSAFEVVGIPFKKPGLYVVELESALLGKALLNPPKPMFVPAAALVTNLSVHFKQGRESSLVWVTTLDRGEPVSHAAVTVTDCKGGTFWQGVTDESGIARINAALPDAGSLPECDYETTEYEDTGMGALRGLGRGLFVMARSGEDMSFVHSSWHDGIEPWRFNISSESESGIQTAHTILDRSLIRAGETLHMKHILRTRTMSGFSVSEDEKRPDTAFIRHIGSDQTYAFPLTWDAGGVAESRWEIPREAKLGAYSIALGKRAAGPKEGEAEDAPAEETVDSEGGELQSGRFRIEEFRVPLMKGTIQVRPEPLIHCREAEAALGVQYLSGGGAGRLPVQLRTAFGDKILQPFEGYEDVVFGNGSVREGIFRQGEPEDSAEGGKSGQTDKLQNQRLDLDANGFATAKIGPLPRSDRLREMTVEMEYSDPNGEIQTVSSRVPLWNSGRLVGIRPENWAMSTESIRFKTAVVDLTGKPVADAPVKVTLFQRNVISHRKRLVGGFYSYDHSTEIKRIGTFYEGKTDSTGWADCEGRSPVSGEVILVAETRDPSGNPAYANQSIWVAGKKEWWFESENDDRMDLIPEKKRYEPGETAVFQVRMPFREATALITVEREGVMETRVQKLSGRQPVISVPVPGNYAPNVFVSVLAVRGRTADVQPTALADLGKPAFRMGMAEIRVGWRAHELNVSVTSDRKTYKVRDKAAVSVKVTTADGKTPPPGTEVALAAVDEGLLELMANSSWNILPAMMGKRGCSVQTATAQMQVVGKRHFGLKALTQGGGGGHQVTRDLFDTLLLWKARLPLDDSGEARIEVPLNDSITGFRIAAVATGASGMFGTGAASIQSFQDVSLFSGLPLMVREGDAYRAAVTVRNGSSQALSLTVSARAEGMGDLPAAPVSLAAGESRQIGWDAVTPEGRDALHWEIEARADTGEMKDRLRVSQQVLPAVLLSVRQADLIQLKGPVSVSVERPAGALSGGGIQADVRPRLCDSLTSVVDYMKHYPYGCLEQKISVAVARQDKALWDRWMADISAYLDDDGLAKYFPKMTLGDPVLTAYILSVSLEAGWAPPDEFVQKAAEGLQKFVEGKIVRRSGFPTADLTLRKLAAIEALSRLGKADPSMLGSIVIEPDHWPTSAVIDWLNILTRLNLPEQKDMASEAEQVLRSRMTYSGSMLGFSTSDSDRLYHLMVSGDVNAARLLLAALPLENWHPDIPELVRGVLARQKSGRWDLTTANAWGVLAMSQFSKRFEPDPVSGETTITLGDQRHRFDGSVFPKGESVLLSWPDERSALTADHHGQGFPWLSIRSLAAVPVREPVFRGYRLQKIVTPVEQKTEGLWTRGDILRVRLEIEAQSDMTWVAVSDPVPAGAVILGSGLGRDSRLLSRGEDRLSDLWPAYVERSLSAYRAYYDDAPKGKWAIEYTLRLNQSGRFQMPPTRVEALYAPEMYGESPNEFLEIAP